MKQVPKCSECLSIHHCSFVRRQAIDGEKAFVKGMRFGEDCKDY